MTVPYILTSKSITVFIDKPYVVGETHPFFAQIKQALMESKSAEEIKSMIDLKHFIGSYGSEYLQVYADHVEDDKGNVLHGSLVDRILTQGASNMPMEHLAKFLKNLYKNPSRRAIDELYSFLEGNSLPITSDGCFLAYKGVRYDYKDCYSSTYDNSVGKRLTMARHDVDDDAQRGCSYGFHVGRFEYAKDFMPSDGHLVVCKVNPKDVVSVPYDCACAKCRVCNYQVVGEVKVEDCTDDLKVLLKFL